MSETVPAAGSLAAAPPAPKSGLIGWIERRPQAAFGAFLALHFAVWTALPAFLYPNLPLDLIEALAYGREWVLGSDKLPPLPWWLVEIAYRVFGVDTAYYALAQGTVVVAFALVFATARRLVGPLGALVAVLIIDGIHYFQYTAVKFNHDVIQLPFWAMAGYAFHAALKRGRVVHWCLLGVAFGGALWAKYFVVVLAAPYVLFVLIDKEARRSLATPGPWLALAIALIIASPHVLWLLRTDFLPLGYVEHRAAAVRGWWDHLFHPAFFLGSQIFFMLPTLLIAAAYAWRREATPLPLAGRERIDAFDHRIVTLLAFGPALAMIALIAFSGRGAVAMWGYPLWLFLGLWIMLFLPRRLDGPRLRLIGAIWGGVFVATAVIFALNYTLVPRYGIRYRAEFFPGQALADELTARFHAATGRKLSYVIGTTWIAGNVAHYSPDHPQVLVEGRPQRAPWINLDDLRAKGALLVWDMDPERQVGDFAAFGRNIEVGTPFVLPMRYGSGVEHIGWAVLRPQAP